MTCFRLALIQLTVGKNKTVNLHRAADLVRRSARSGRANLVVLPECFNSPYGTEYFSDYAEEIDCGETCQALSEVARECSVHLIGGSIPERRSGSLFNTTTAWGPDGELLATYSKTHLFDIDIPGKIRFQESETLSPGSRLSTLVTPFCRVGLGICYDVRFADMAAVYARNGCDLLVYPGAFNMTTGPLHWQLLCQARSLDNQLFTAMVSPARDESASYVAWGHSMVTSPWGEVLASAGHTEDIIYADIDLSECDNVRRSIPLRRQKRPDLYSQPLQL